MPSVDMDITVVTAPPITYEAFASIREAAHKLKPIGGTSQVGVGHTDAQTLAVSAFLTKKNIIYRHHGKSEGRSLLYGIFYHIHFPSKKVFLSVSVICCRD